MAHLLTRATSAYASLLSREEGQALVEYALILSLVSLAVIGVLAALGHTPSSLFSRVNADFH